MHSQFIAKLYRRGVSSVPLATLMAGMASCIVIAGYLQANQQEKSASSDSQPSSQAKAPQDRSPTVGTAQQYPVQHAPSSNAWSSADSRAATGIRTAQAGDWPASDWSQNFDLQPAFAKRWNESSSANNLAIAQAYSPKQESPADQMARKLSAVPKADRTEQQLTQLRELLNAEFDKRHAEQLERLERVKADAEKTETILRQRKDQQSQIVDRRMAQLLGERDELSWDYSDATARGPQRAGGFPQPFPVTAPAGVGQTIPPFDGGVPTTKSFPFAGEMQAPTASTAATKPSLAPTTGEAASSALSLTAGNNPSYAQNDIVHAGFSLENTEAALKQIEKLAKNQIVSSSELEKAQRAFEEAKTRWQFKTRELELEKELLLSEMESAAQGTRLLSDELAQLKQMVSNGLSKPSELVEKERELSKATQELRAAEIGLQRLEIQLKWSTEFDKKRQEKNNAKVEFSESTADSPLLPAQNLAR